jgi:hypothetical protein
MASRRLTPPWDYLHQASAPSLESFELSRLNHAANVRREIAALIDQWVEDSAQALLARWVREDRALSRGTEASAENAPQPELPFSEALPGQEPPRRSERGLRLSRRGARVSSVA